MPYPIQRSETAARPRPQRRAAERLALAAAMLLGCLAPSAPIAATTLVFSHVGATDPETVDADPTVENWTLVNNGGGTAGPLANDLGLASWYVDDSTGSGQYYYRQNTTPYAASAAFGWTLRATLRVDAVSDAPDCAIFLESWTSGRRYYLGLGSVGGQTRYLQNACSGGGAAADPPETSPTQYRTFEIAWNPNAGADGEADVYIDGRYQPATSGWAGDAAIAERVVFGANHTSGLGQGNYHLVEWEVGVQDCRDGIDNDGDGLVDFGPGGDAGCESDADPSEYSPDLECDDGVDNDGDGDVDGLDAECGLTGRSESVIPLALDYNFNGIHHAESGTPSLTGYRSISDRGLDWNNDPSLSTGYLDGNSGLVYSIVQDADTPDLVHLGNRMTVDDSSKPIAVLPDWLPDPDQTGPQVSTFAPVALDANSAIGILYQVSNGGGSFALTLGFQTGDPVTVTVHGPDWVGPHTPGLRNAGVARQETLPDLLAGVAGVDSPFPSLPLNLTETIVSVESVMAAGMGDLSGRLLTSLAISDRSTPAAGYALLAASVGIAPAISPVMTEPIPVGVGDLHVVGSSAPEVSRDEDNLVNGSGMGLNFGSLVSENLIPDHSHWNTQTLTADVVFDLGKIRPIDLIQIWNFNTPGETDFGPTTIEVQVSNIGTSAQDADFSASPIVATLPIFEASPSTSYRGENYAFNGTIQSEVPVELQLATHHPEFSGLALGGRFVKLGNLDGSALFGGRTGLSEVRFYTIPEPGLTAMLGAGLLGLVGLGRRRACILPRPPQRRESCSVTSCSE